MLFLHPEGVHHHGHRMRRDQNQQDRQVNLDIAERTGGRMKMQQPDGNHHGDHQRGAKADDESLEPRQRDCRPQQRQNDEGERKGQVAQRQIAEGQRDYQRQQQSVQIQRIQHATAINQPDGRQRQDANSF
ncbi:hypothetical protein D3C80_564650 [compost metagenome]